MSRAAALRHSVELAQVTEALGYSRFWVAEHHHSASFAGAAPEVLVATVLERTQHIRVGSGGVLLPRYTSAKVAEVFQTLGALHPGRVDLGGGRGGSSADQYAQQVHDLHRFLQQTTVPMQPELWVLGTGTSSSSLAGHIGTGFAFGHFLNPGPAAIALASYRESFRPAPPSPYPWAALAVRVIVGETEASALDSLEGLLLWRSSKDLDVDTPFPSWRTVRRHAWTPRENERRAAHLPRVVAGTASQVRRDLQQLASRRGIGEIVVNTPIFDQRTRLQSYELLAAAFHVH
ncbi:MsnO8 family LLM class oxidoreductase (plasmid) [Deinococcus sp. QL22]|nr:MsnO8 family LLM class oxidoreductase [Deinococcus sp. QL22]UQN08543.1 MsnO8 family LLM class oxidoreductase [Deinococcus sp. QL22]